MWVYTHNLHVLLISILQLSILDSGWYLTEARRKLVTTPSLPWLKEHKEHPDEARCFVPKLKKPTGKTTMFLQTVTFRKNGCCTKPPAQEVIVLSKVLAAEVNYGYEARNFGRLDGSKMTKQLGAKLFCHNTVN